METQTNGTIETTAPAQSVAPLPSLKWDMSTECAALFASLSKAQGEIQSASKGETNTHFGNRYADLDAVWEACREPLSKNGLAVIQMPRTWQTDKARGVTLRALLTHASGQWISCELTMEVQDLRPQTVGSAITYARRYTLAPLVGVAPGDDDDGEGAEGRNAPRQAPQRQQRQPEREAPKGPPMSADTNRKITKIAEGLKPHVWRETVDRFGGRVDALTEDVAQKIIAAYEAKNGTVAQ